MVCTSLSGDSAKVFVSIFFFDLALGDLLLDGCWIGWLVDFVRFLVFLVGRLVNGWLASLLSIPRIIPA